MKQTLAHVARSQPAIIDELKVIVEAFAAYLGREAGITRYSTSKMAEYCIEAKSSHFEHLIGKRFFGLVACDSRRNLK